MTKKILFIISLFLLPLFSFAYSEESFGGDVEVTVTPDNPEPGQQITVTLRGYGLNIDASQIGWSVDGKSAGAGWGKKEFSFNLKKERVPTTLQIKIQDRQGNTALKTLTFYPNNVDLLWEADSYTPPFYKGKALPTAGSRVKIVAMPDFVSRNGRTLSSSGLIFRWKKDGLYLPSFSGLGKDSMSFQIGENETSNKIEVEVTDPAEEASITKSLVINTATPEIVFYEKKPLEGVDYSRALSGNFLLNKDEMTLKAEPYFFSFNQSSELVPNWSLNDNQLVSQQDDPFTLTLRKKTSADSGTNKISLSVNKVNSLLQAIKETVFVSFGVKETSI